MGGRRMNYRQRLTIAFLLLGVLPSLLVGWLGYRVGANVLADSARSAMRATLRQGIGAISMLLDETSERATALSIDPDMNAIIAEGGDVSGSKVLDNRRKLTFTMKRYFGSSALLYTAQMYAGGTAYALNTNLPVSSAPVLPDGALARARASDGALIWTDVYDYYRTMGLTGAEARNTTWVFGAVRTLNVAMVPLIDGGHRLYPKRDDPPVLALYFRADVFNAMLDEMLNIEGSRYLMLTRDGRVIASSDPKLTGQLREGGPEPGMLSVEDEMPVTGWRIALSAPMGAVIGQMSLIQIGSIGLAALMTLVSTVVAFGFSRRVTRPVYRLIDGIRRSGGGDFDFAVPEKGDDEFRLLTNQFNRMNERIRTLIAENYLREIREKEAQILALNHQLNPHFLYNTLGTMNWMAIERGQAEISNMIVNLCDMLRYTAAGDDRIVPFHEDVRWLESYLFIMSMRFPDRFDARLSVPEAVLGVRVPKLFLQPFIENAILHGFEHMDRGGVLTLRCELTGEEAVFELADNGQGMPQALCRDILRGEAGNIGIQNAIRRIRLIYGERAAIEMDAAPGAGVRVTVRLPHPAVEGQPKTA